MTRLRNGRRLTLGLELRRSDALYQSDRDILPDPEIPFDAIGNITGVGGGEIDPALSAAAREYVTIAPVPAAPSGGDALADFAGTANRPRRFDLGPYRTLAPRNHGFKAEAVVADRIGETISGSLTLSAEQSRDRSVTGPATLRLTIPESNIHSPFSGPVVLNRYLIETDLLGLSQKVTSLHAGVTLRGAIAGWSWDFTGVLDQKQTDEISENGIDPRAINAAVDAGADPFAPFDASLLGARLTDRTRLRTRSAGGKTVVAGNPLRLPAGEVTLTGTVEADRATIVSRSRGPAPFDLQLGRTRIEGAVAVDIPLASRREKILSFIGDVSLNGSLNVRRVSGFGSLRDSSYGFAWGPFEGVQLLATIRHSTAAPDMTQLAMPVLSVENVPVFDYVNGRTELVTLIRGGNPDLEAERRRVGSLSLSIKPFADRDLRAAVTYEATTVRDQTATLYAVTPEIEAILPGLFTRDAGGRLLSVAYRPINLELQRQRTLNFTINSSGKLGKSPPRAPESKEEPPQRPGYYAGIGPTVKFTDRIQLRQGSAELDLLEGDTIHGRGSPRVYGYVYGGVYHRGHGFRLNAWYAGPNRVRSDDPASDLRFSSVFRLNIGAYVNLSRLLKIGDWKQRLRLALDIDNVTDNRQHVRDRNGDTPYRYQPDILEPIGRRATLSLRKLF